MRAVALRTCTTYFSSIHSSADREYTQKSKSIFSSPCDPVCSPPAITEHHTRVLGNTGNQRSVAHKSMAETSKKVAQFIVGYSAVITPYRRDSVVLCIKRRELMCQQPRLGRGQHTRVSKQNKSTTRATIAGSQALSLASTPASLSARERHHSTMSWSR